MFRMLLIKQDCFLVYFVQNVRYLVGTSDVTTISNDQGNILQILCKTLLKKNEYCCVVQMHGSEHNVSGDSEAMLSFFGGSKFSVRVYNTSDIPIGQTLAINSSKIQLS